MNMNNEYPIGTKYMTRGKAPRECTVIDVLKTYNSKNELVHTRYVSTHIFAGQTVTNKDVVATTIAMGLIQPESTSCEKCGQEGETAEDGLCDDCGDEEARLDREENVSDIDSSTGRK